MFSLCLYVSAHLTHAQAHIYIFKIHSSLNIKRMSDPILWYSLHFSDARNIDPIYKTNDTLNISKSIFSNIKIH